jgi:DNA polymerase-3 subunit epsilon
MREIVLDTETTGLDPRSGDRVVEIGCVELNFHVPTGRELHLYINPERDMPEEAFAIHGISEDFLKDKPIFADIVDEFLEFLGDDAALVIHNAPFDAKFLNWELEALKKPPIPATRLIDTLEIARKKYPGGSNSLDALCRRFDVDLSVREKHGAVIDCRLLAAVYLELIGGKQPGLLLSADQKNPISGTNQKIETSSSNSSTNRKKLAPRPHSPSLEELKAHEAFLMKIKDPLWLKGIAGSD